MTLYLRNKEKQSLVNIELNRSSQGIVDLSSVVVIEPYSELLINNLDRKEEIIADFAMIGDLRGWLWEYYDVKYDKDDLGGVLDELRVILRDVAEKYSLSYIES